MVNMGPGSAIPPKTAFISCFHLRKLGEVALGEKVFFAG
jgi:hypothetical protein